MDDSADKPRAVLASTPSIDHAVMLSVIIETALNGYYGYNIKPFNENVDLTQMDRFVEFEGEEESTEHMRKVCLVYIDALITYSSVWKAIETTSHDHDRYRRHSILIATIDEMRAGNDELFLRLRALFKGAASDDPINPPFRRICQANQRYSSFPLHTIRYAISAGRLILMMQRHAEYFLCRCEELSEVFILQERRKQLSAVSEFNEMRNALRAKEAEKMQSNDIYYALESRTHRAFFDQLFTKGDPLPFSLFVAQHFELSHVCRPSGRPDLDQLMDLIDSIKNDTDSHNAQFLEQLIDLRLAHEQLVSNAQDLVTKISGQDDGVETICSNTATRPAATAALGDAVHSYIFGESYQRIQAKQQARQTFPTSRDLDLSDGAQADPSCHSQTPRPDGDERKQSYPRDSKAAQTLQGDDSPTEFMSTCSDMEELGTVPSIEPTKSVPTSPIATEGNYIHNLIGDAPDGVLSAPPSYSQTT